VLSCSINKASEKVLVVTVRKFLALNGTSLFTIKITEARLNQIWLEALYKLYIIPMFLALNVSEFDFIRCISCQKNHFQISRMQL